MKRILMILLVSLLLMLSACSDSKQDSGQDNNNNQQVPVDVPLPADNEKETANSDVIEVENKNEKTILYEDAHCLLECWGPSTSSSAYKLCFQFRNKTSDKNLVFYADNLQIEGTSLEMVRSYKLGDGVYAWGAMFCNAGSGMLGEFAYNKYDAPGFDIPKYENISFTVHVVDQAAYPEELVNLPVKLHYASN